MPIQAKTEDLSLYFELGFRVVGCIHEENKVRKGRRRPSKRRAITKRAVAATEPRMGVAPLNHSDLF